MGKRCPHVVITAVVLSKRERGREERAVPDRDGAHNKGQQWGGWVWRGRRGSEVSDGGGSQREILTENRGQQMDGGRETDLRQKTKQNKD